MYGATTTWYVREQSIPHCAFPHGTSILGGERGRGFLESTEYGVQSTGYARMVKGGSNGLMSRAFSKWLAG